MKRIRKIICLNIVISVILLCFSSCGKIHMDEEKCAEVALEYMINKYGKEFVLIDSSEKMGISGPMGEAEVEVKTAESENSYYVLIYPDGKSDKNNDGYYDKYKVISDDYMCHLLNASVKKEVDKLLMEAGLTRFISSVGIKNSAYGFLADFPLQDENKFSLCNIMNDYKITISCYVDIPESEYSDALEDTITNVFNPLLSEDLVKIDIDVYEEKKFNEFEEQIKNGKSYYGGLGTKRIYFSIKED